MAQPPEALVRRLSLAAELMLPDEATLTESIYQQRVAVWQDTLTEEARAVGSARTGQRPGGNDAQYLRDVSRDDARSIRQTYQRELEHQIEALYTANPDGRRDYYLAALTAWADERAAYKDRQIANMNRGTARQYAQLRFRDENRLQDATARFVGPPAREPECQALFAVGAVPLTYAEAHPTPVHIGCPHNWQRFTGRPGVPLDQLWVGG